MIQERIVIIMFKRKSSVTPASCSGPVSGEHGSPGGAYRMAVT